MAGRIEFQDGIDVYVTLPEGFEIIPNSYEEDRLRIEFFPQQTFGIEKDAEHQEIAESLRIELAG